MFGRDPYSYDNGHEDGLREGRSQANAQWRSKLESAEARIRGLEQLNADLAAAPRSDCERNLQRAIADLGALERLRTHPGLSNLVQETEGQRHWWACVAEDCDEPEDEDMKRTALECAEAHALLLELLQPGEVSRD
jgi:hypothetical protein